MTHDSEEFSLLEHARFLVALGRHDFGSVVRQCAEILDDPSDADVRRVVADEFAAHLADQETWPDELDTDRLQRAFRELDTSGIVARLDHTCCQNCGITELGEEVARGDEPRGYAFAHRQDMRAAVPGGPLTLAYGLFCEGEQPPEAQAEIGAEIAAALRRHGLDVDWDGSPRRRIDVSLDWKRRRYGYLAEYPGSAAPAERPLEISYQNGPSGGVQTRDVPVSPAEARDVLLSVTPYSGNYINFITEEGGIIAMWEQGPRLKFEIPDPEKRCYYSRHVTVEEAEEVVGILAREGRVALSGDLTTEYWGG
ncbi:hypothetical protein BJF79_23840 [Actinomadura sp. CNU-125]|uniref:DUF6891 domain-containing protein n=1 Tax=Actinomadura sp. CNU-125 TaxID=1904961 RepID=UPI0009690095|nr:hypothetical protein [Actinomadura sp. CNU-125]OLT11597.1 hypothetical protein BJF79_23840 [Actinomadura sp. CNU-125]